MLARYEYLFISIVEYNFYQYDRLTRCFNGGGGNSQSNLNMNIDISYEQQHDPNMIKKIDLLRRYNLQCFGKLI